MIGPILATEAGLLLGGADAAPRGVPPRGGPAPRPRILLRLDGQHLRRCDRPHAAGRRVRRVRRAEGAAAPASLSRRPGNKAVPGRNLYCVGARAAVNAPDLRGLDRGECERLSPVLCDLGGVRACRGGCVCVEGWMREAYVNNGQAGPQNKSVSLQWTS